MKIKKLLSLICSFSILVSSLFYCKAEIPEIRIAVFGDSRIIDENVLHCLMQRKIELHPGSVDAVYALNQIKFNFYSLDWWCMLGLIRKYSDISGIRDVHISRCNLGIIIVSSYICDEAFLRGYIDIYIKNAKNKDIIIVLGTSPTSSNNSYVDSLRNQLIEELEKYKIESPENRIINLDIDNDESKANLQQHFFNNIGQVQERLKQERK